MKINITVDCTPEEARAAIGLPDLTPLHAKATAAMLDALDGKIAPELVGNLMRSWFPDGAGLQAWQQLFRSGQRDG